MKLITVFNYKFANSEMSRIFGFPVNHVICNLQCTFKENQIAYQYSLSQEWWTYQIDQWPYMIFKANYWSDLIWNFPNPFSANLITLLNCSRLLETRFRIGIFWDISHAADIFKCCRLRHSLLTFIHWFHYFDYLIIPNRFALVGNVS